MPPWIWIASSATMASISVALSLAIAMSMSSTVFWSNFQAASRVSSSGRLEFERHVGELEGHALELADLLAELDAVDRPLLGMVERPLGAADAGGGDLEPGGAEPGIGDLEALVNLAQDLPICGTRQSVNSRMQLL